MRHDPFTHRQDRSRLDIGLQFGYVRRRRWRRGAEKVLENPFAAHDRRGSVRLRGDGQYAALSEQAAANVVLVERDPPEVNALDVWNPVVAREPFIQERVVRCEKLQSSAVFVHDRVEEEFCFTLERLTQVVVEIRKYDGDWSGARPLTAGQALA